MANTQLQDIFPRPESQRIPDEVLAEMAEGEPVIWHGVPDRWGLFRATPFVVAIVLAVGVSIAMSSGTGLTPAEYLWRLAGSLGADPALIATAAAAMFFGFLAASLRDPRNRWTYVVTDRRMITFHKGRKLREADITRLERLRVVQGLEARIRDVGHVVWERIRYSENSRVRGPDQGEHGFRGMRNPKDWAERLQSWGQALSHGAAADAREFRSRAAEPNAGAPPPSGSRVLRNRRFGFEMTLPGRWVGRIGRQQRKPFELFGLELPLQSLERVSKRPLHDSPEDWNYIEVQGRSGMKFTVNVNEGLPVATFETSRDKVADKLVDADGDFRCGPLSGYRVDYGHLGKRHCRFAMLAGDGFHMLFNVAIPLAQAEDLLPAVDAVFDSIRER
jgi:hypothetical protein